MLNNLKQTNMKGYTFYLEYPTKKDKCKATRKDLGNHSGNVLAVYGNWFNIKNLYSKKECISSVRGLNS